MKKNKWTVKIILLVTVILAGLILCINSINGIPDAETNYKEIYSAMLNANQEENLTLPNYKGFEVNNEQKQGNGFEIPAIVGREIYCIEKGVGVAFSGAMQSKDGKGKTYDYTWGSTITSIFTPINNPHMKSKQLSPKEKSYIDTAIESNHHGSGAKRTIAYYTCKDPVEASPEEAYVITAEPCNKWTPRKQIVMWWLNITGEPTWNKLYESLTKEQQEVARSEKDKIIQLYNEAIKYGEYKRILDGQSEYASNLTDADNITSECYTSTSGSEKYIKIGPYSMDYLDGKADDLDIIFGGIGGKEYNNPIGLYIKNGNQRIKVEKIITNNKETNTKYFNPRDIENSNDISGYYVENTEDEMSPSSGQEFYVLISETKLEADAELYAHFTWMEATGIKGIMDGISYQITDSSFYNNGKLRLDNKGRITFEAKATQQLGQYVGKRELKEQDLPLGKVQPPSKEGSYSINMRKIYEDENGVEHGLKGAVFLINGLLTCESDEEGYILSGQQIINASGTETWTVEEKSAPAGYITQPLKIVFKIYKVYNSTTNTYEVDRIEIVSSNSNAEVTFNKEDQTITVKIKNIKANPENPGDLLNTYKIKAKKVDEQGNGLAGAKFNITWPKGQTSEATSNENGDLVISGQIPKLLLNSERKDHFKIEEIEAPAGYKMIDGAIEFDVEIGKADIGKNAYVIKGIINVNAPEGVTIELNGRGEISIVIPNQKDIQLISIGGNVWEDAKTGKASLGDGINSTTNNVDKNLENIKVSLYTEDMKLAELMPDDSVTNIYNRINPTLTDANGNYKFEGVCVDESKKYYVVFEYDGQIYMPTEYLAKGISGDTIQNYNSVEEMLGELTNIGTGRDNGNSGNTGGKNTGTGTNTGSGKNTQTNTEWFEKWKANSKASEFETNTGKNTIEGRQTFNNRFAEIGSSPKNYMTKNNLNIKSYLTYSDGKYYNKTYTRLELMGYTLKRVDGKPEYVQDKVQLVDGYKYNKYGTLNYDENGRVTNEWAEGLISTKIKEFIKNNNKYPNSKELRDIYQEIAGTDKEMWKKLQFIEDCKISAITKSPFNSGIEYYPTNKNATFGTDLLTNYINLGLWRRQEFNALLSKDVTAIEYTINGKTETYKYDGKKTALENIKSCMDTYVTAIDTNLAWTYSKVQENINRNRISYKYYNAKYNRPIYNSDYVAKAGIGEDLDVRIKYRITITNISQSIEMKVKEIVDYYDDSLTLREVKINGTNITLIPRKSIYGTLTETNFNGYNKIYISGDVLEEQISTGGEINIDLTYKVNNMRMNDLEDYLNIGDKTNIAEINGYKTYYAANTSTPNRHGAIIGNNTTVAGLVDVNSTPGNLSTTETITNEVYNFEDDSDKIVATLEIKPDPDNPGEKAKRTINGYVWEDSKVSDGLGNGVMEDSETKICGVDVALCEKVKIATNSYEGDDGMPQWINIYNQQLKGYKYVPVKTYNGESWTPAVKQTDDKGYYEFTGFIPGDYYVIFGYGYSKETLLPKNSETTKLIEEFGKNNKSYNGQDYKSTIFENGINIKISSWRDDLGTYSYSLDNEHISDAVDDLDRVDTVISYSKEQKNHIAEVLVSPYNVPKYPKMSYEKKEMKQLLEELKEKTWKVARTRKIDAKVEYASNGTTDGTTKTEWTLPNIDLGLVERPKTQLEITKNVKNIKVTLSDGSIVFDATQRAEKTEVKDAIWKSNIFSTTRGTTPTWGFIQLYLDEELMYGATIQIEYNMNITQPINERDFTGDKYYVKGEVDGKLVTTKATEVICYIPNKMQFDKEVNDGWNLIEDEQSGSTEGKNTQNEIFEQGLVNENLKDEVNSIKTKVKIEDSNATDISDISENNLTVSQLITRDGAQGGYVSVAEIVKIQNDVGRRMTEYIIKSDNKEKTIYPIVGNQDPTNKPAEIDSAQGENVAVMPPFGIGQVFYYVLTVVIAGMLVVGIIFIKKKVLVK